MVQQGSVWSRVVHWCRAHPPGAAAIAVLVVVLGVIVSLTGSSPKDSADAGTSDGQISMGPTASGTQPGTRPAARPSSGAVSSTPLISNGTGPLAAAVLASLAVKGRAPKTGYGRDQFGPAWTDDNDDLGGHNGCDTRNDILRRDLVDDVAKPGTRGCVLLAGMLHDPYTGQTIRFRRGPRSADVQIDHVVALGDAWQTGVQGYRQQTRTDLANDPLNLLAVDGSTNESKGDADAATWLPPNKTFRCFYVARQVAVKARYKLWVTAAESQAVHRVLSACPGQRVPTEAGRPPLTRASYSGSAPSPPKPTRTAPPPMQSARCTTTSSDNCIKRGQLCPQDSYDRSGIDSDGDTLHCVGDAVHPHWQ